MLLRTAIETIFGIALFANSLLFIPQIIQLLKTKNSQGLSLTTFAGFGLIQLASILHGYIKHDYLLIFGFTLSLLACGTVTFLIAYYRIDHKLRRGK